MSDEDDEAEIKASVPMSTAEGVPNRPHNCRKRRHLIQVEFALEPRRGPLDLRVSVVPFLFQIVRDPRFSAPELSCSMFSRWYVNALTHC